VGIRLTNFTGVRGAVARITGENHPLLARKQFQILIST
jgi:hypothetical protein